MAQDTLGTELVNTHRPHQNGLGVERTLPTCRTEGGSAEMNAELRIHARHSTAERPVHSDAPYPSCTPRSTNLLNTHPLDNITGV